jgi:phage replication O-like protein O
MSDRLKPNFTPVPNVILDEIMRGLNEGQFKTLMAICRKTYGWGKHSDQISLSQLADITGMDRSNVARARKGLGNLVTVTPGTAITASTYQLNIDISDDDLAAVGSDSSATSDRSATSVKGSDSSATYKRKQKKEDIPALKRSASSSISKKRRSAVPADPRQIGAFNMFYAAFPRHVDRAGAEKAWLDLNPDPELTARIMKAVRVYADSIQDVEPRFIKHPGPWLRGKRWEDELPVNSGNGNHAKPVIVKTDEESQCFVLADGSRIAISTYRRMYGG